jgi:hypothetical protein
MRRWITPKKTTTAMASSNTPPSSVSTDGQHDGLYWAPDDSGEISPLGPVFGDDTPKGDYLGYHYKILTKQGASAPGGARDFMLGNDMVRGFALVAWPAKYGDTGW